MSKVNIKIEGIPFEVEAGMTILEAAKECEFGLIKRGGEWTLDERLLSGTKAFFNLF